jgi:putative photosynthetic complex assembly protein 2
MTRFADIGLPVLYTLFVWWFSTGAILYLDGLPRSTYRWSMLGATALLVGALHGLAVSSADASVAGAYVAFTCSVLVWGWVEMSFLMGFVTGPRQTACPPGARGWVRAGYAVQAILYHEVALLAGIAAIVAVTWDGANQIGTWTFLILWAMRLSAKLNVFLGVRNLYAEFLPEHLRYLQSYFTQRPMNLLFPFAVTASTVAVVLVWREAFAAGAGSFEVAGLTFLGMLLALAVLEHWFLVVPLPATALWQWGLRSRTPCPPATELPVAVVKPPLRAFTPGR